MSWLTYSARVFLHFIDFKFKKAAYIIMLYTIANNCVTIISKRKTLVETRNFYDPLTKISLFNKLKEIIRLTS